MRAAFLFLTFFLSFPTITVAEGCDCGSRPSLVYILPEYSEEELDDFPWEITKQELAPKEVTGLDEDTCYVFIEIAENDYTGMYVPDGQIALYVEGEWLLSDEFEKKGGCQ